jgi:hypothetical protein
VPNNSKDSYHYNIDALQPQGGPKIMDQLVAIVESMLRIVSSAIGNNTAKLKVKVSPNKKITLDKNESKSPTGKGASQPKCDDNNFQKLNLRRRKYVD